uniref:Uncharacterized protein n=1 Tax=Rhizophora mucronata TaxID=61149 RepID=A0A2P2Q6U5_RHIMU
MIIWFNLRITTTICVTIDQRAIVVMGSRYSLSHKRT